MARRPTTTKDETDQAEGTPTAEVPVLETSDVSVQPDPTEVSPETETEPDEKKAYRVTETAPPRVAGRRVKAGDTVQLTPAEALSEELQGSVEAVSKAD
ncbi:hypothetical protein [Notoacmeibacter ruber]|uniref:Uncharacterized protein n=1 Tax=Notoacmeibacter ruber TaxID=2670375 RepID=A0A3L7JF08_9HYPH|nr:hypothetical protein [Notoacmeibacter ruber]RLQ88915.1 hypothetical protein D8780_12440 [Notoacmeibacter ruber]